jgi:hypothetical protein
MLGGSRRGGRYFSVAVKEKFLVTPETKKERKSLVATRYLHAEFTFISLLQMLVHGPDATA